MRRGLLLVVFAGIVAGAGCGGGHEQVDAAPDAAPDRPVLPDLGPDDRPEPVDGPQEDVILPPADGPTCDPLSGHVTGSLCTIDFDCACPRGCLRLRAAPATGSCWMRCDPAANDPGSGENPACQAGETCRAGEGDTGGCLPRGTLTGTFDVPVYTPPAQPGSPADLGTAAVTLDVGLVGQMVFDSGWGTSATVGGQDGYRLYLFPGSGATVDWDKPLVIELEANSSWQPNVTFDLSQPTARIEYHEYGELHSRDVLRAEAVAGSLTLTATGTGNREPATGAFSNGRAIEYEAELCGPSTVPCQ